LTKIDSQVQHTSNLIDHLRIEAADKSDNTLL
jgi:hypothetical protein